MELHWTHANLAPCSLNWAILFTVAVFKHKIQYGILTTHADKVSPILSILLDILEYFEVLLLLLCYLIEIGFHAYIVNSWLRVFKTR